TLSAAIFGLGPQAPAPFAALMGYKGTDEYVYRLAGAACFGYAVTGIQELRSLHWDDMRLPNVIAIVFNGLAFLASAFEILAGGKVGDASRGLSHLGRDHPHTVMVARVGQT